MKNYIKIFLDSVLAGVVIGIGGTVYVSMDNKIVGSLLFTVGLYAILLNEFSLYTGKVGYLVQQPTASYIMDLIVTWFGNLSGTIMVGKLILQTRVHLTLTVEKLCIVKLQDTWYSIFILSIFCGILMFIAVDGYKKKHTPIILFLCVSVFILSGFEHCIANMFYITVAKVWSVKAMTYILLMTLGNSVGGVLIPLIKQRSNKLLLGK
ncbi:formate/nitrite transporter family protein [Lachnospiraceae bacterium LCP25S3_G4]